MGLISNEPDLAPGEQVILRFGAGYFPVKMLNHGGLLYLTTQRVIFRSHKLDRALTTGLNRIASRRPSGDLIPDQTAIQRTLPAQSVDLPLAKITSVGSTPPWGPPPRRKYLRIDASDRSFLFLFSVLRPRWRATFTEELASLAPSASVTDGWGFWDPG